VTAPSVVPRRVAPSLAPRARRPVDLAAAVGSRAERRRRRIETLLDRGWYAAVRWAFETVAGLPGPDGARPTNLDRYNAATFLAEVRGEYAPARVAIEPESNVVVAFGALTGPVVGEEERDALPHVSAPEARYPS